MAKATTVLSPREVMIRLAKVWRPLFNDINSHYTVNSQGKVILDKKTVEDMSIFSSIEKKLKDAFLQQLLNDAKLVREEAKKKRDYGIAEKLLKDIESMLKSIKREELIRKRQARYLRNLAKHLGGNVKKIEGEIRKEERRAKRELEKTFKAKTIKGKEKQKIFKKMSKHKTKPKQFKFPFK